MPKERSNRVAVVLGFGQDFWLDQRVQRTARALAASNYEVFAYTPFESRVHEYSINGIEIIYIKSPLGNNKIIKKMLLSYIIFDIAAAFDIVKRRVDICHCNDFDTVPCGAILKLISFGRVKVVYDSHEDFPLFIEWGRGKLLAKVIRIAEYVLARYFVDRVITVSEGINAKFEKKSIKAEIVLNCPEWRDKSVANKNITLGEENDQFKIVYQGKIFPQRGYEKLIEAADILINERNITELKFIIIGDSGRFESYEKSLLELLQDKGLNEYFSFTGFVNYDDMMKMLTQADVGVMPFELTRKNEGALPNKFFENLMAGIPTIASNVPEIARIITQEKCGLLVNPKHPEEIADAIEYLIKNEDIKLQMGRNALKAAQEKYNFTKQAEKLLRVYGEIS